MSSTVSVTYGKERVGFDIPQGALLTPPIGSREAIPKQGTPSEIILSALKNPVDSRPFSEIVQGKNVGLISSDEFRSGLQKEIISTLIPEIASAAPKKIKVLIATGSHEISIYARNVREWAEGALEGVPVEHQVIANDCCGDDFADIGSTSGGVPLSINRHLLSCEVRIYAHEAKFHYMNGYSCIDKQVVPGLASMKTIEMSHKNSLDHVHSVAGRNPWHKDPDRQKNPFAEAARDGRKISERYFLGEENGKPEKRDIATFGLDMVSGKGKIFWIMAGNPDTVTRKMTGAVDEISMFRVKPAKYVIVSPGGPPASDAVYGTQNCFDTALKGAIQDGGEALVVAPCAGREDVPHAARGLAPDVKSKELFWDNLVKLKDKPLEECSKFIDENFKLYFWKTDRVLKLMKENSIRLFLHCELPDEKIKQGGFIPAPDVQAWIDERVRRKDGKFLVIDNGNKILVRKE